MHAPANPFTLQSGSSRTVERVAFGVFRAATYFILLCATFIFGKDCMDSLRRTRRELRDEFQSRAAVLHASSQRALNSVERAVQLTPAEREARAAELAERRGQIERLQPARAAA
jgi:hypothetical protein